MKEFPFVNLSPVYIEFGQSILRALRQDDGLEMPLERTSEGRLTDACKGKLVRALQRFVDRKSWQPRVRALCAIGAKGVSLRHITLPPAAKEEFQRLLLLQIESEFPLPPDDLAWGCLRLNDLPNGSHLSSPLHHPTRPTGTPAQPAEENRNDDTSARPNIVPSDLPPSRQELLLAAVRKEVVEEYYSLLLASGLNPVFTLAALARSRLCPHQAGSGAMLDIAATHSELLIFENNSPAAVRVLPWGVENILATGAGLDAFVNSLTAAWYGRTLYVTGVDDGVKNLTQQLAQRLGTRVDCRRIEVPAGQGRSAAVLGLKQAVEENGGAPPLILETQTRTVNRTFRLSQPAPKRWLKIAAVLVAGLLLLPWAEALLFKPFLTRKLANLKSDRGRLTTIDREQEFLQYLKQTQPPYLDALYIFGKAAPKGLAIESLTMNRRGEVNLRGSMRNSKQVVEFRSRLIKSGFFSSVSVDEQAPTPNHQKVSVRISAQWKPFGQRASLSIGPTAEEIEKARTTKKPSPPGMRPGITAPPRTAPGPMKPQKL